MKAEFLIFELGLFLQANVDKASVAIRNNFMWQSLQCYLVEYRYFSAITLVT